MTKIPEDIIKAGRRCYDGLGRGSVSDSEHIARAILAERERWEHVEEVLFDIEQWCRAYPLKVFPEPDFTRAAELLKAGGMNLDAISASNMRHVLTRVEGMIAAIRSQS